MHSSYRWLHTGNFTLPHRWLHILTQVTTHLYTGDYTLSHRWLHIFTQMTTHLYKGDFPYFTRLLYIFTQMTSHCHTGDYTLLCRWLDTFTQVFTQCHIGDYPVYSLTQITTGVSTLPDRSLHNVTGYGKWTSSHTGRCRLSSTDKHSLADDYKLSHRDTVN